MAPSRTRGRSRPLLRMGVGAAIALLSFFGLDWVSGGILGAPSKVSKIQIIVLLECAELPAALRPSFAASISLRNPTAIEVRVIAFDKILDRQMRVQAIRACKKMTIGTNFLPIEASIAPNKKLPDADIKPGRPGEYSISLEGSDYTDSMGHVTFKSETPITHESLSTRALDVVVASGQAGLETQASIDLPEGYGAESSLPPPDRMTSLAWAILYWKGSDEFARSAPILDTLSRGSLQEIGVQLRMSNPRKKRIETTLAFLFTAFFGIGFALSVEAPIRRALGSKDE